MSTRYAPMNQNPSPLEVVNSATFGPGVRRAFQQMSRVDVTPYAIPWSGIDVPMVDDLPQSPNDRAEVNLIVGDGVVRMVYRQATNRWYQIGSAPYVTSLPALTIDGLSIIYAADATNGVFWHLTYDSAQTTYKWVYVGGSPMFAEVATSETTTSTTYAALATAGPSRTVPLAGDYNIRIGHRSSNTDAAAVSFQSYDIGAGAAADARSINFTQINALAANSGGSISRDTQQTVAAAATAIVSKYRVTAGTGTFSDRFISITPIRVI